VEQAISNDGFPVSGNRYFPVSGSRDDGYAEYVVARLSSLRRLAAVLCDDWQRADDLVQATLTKLYVRWSRVRTASHPDAYARTVLVREFIHEQRSPWAKWVSLTGEVTDPRPPRWITTPCSCGQRSRRCPPASAPPWCSAFTAT
jgi:hypothetical protein